MEQIKYVESESLKGNDLPNFSAGDTVTVHYKITEG
jgi:ribosomal protein L19